MSSSLNYTVYNQHVGTESSVQSPPLWALPWHQLSVCSQSCMKWSKMSCVLCVISNACRVTVTGNICTLVRDTEHTSIRASDTEQSVCICTYVFYLLWSRMCILEADNAGLWVLRSGCGRCSTALWQCQRWRGGERGAHGSPRQPWRGGGRIVATWEERMCVGSDLVVVVVFLVVHAGPGRLVLHAL